MPQKLGFVDWMRDNVAGKHRSAQQKQGVVIQKHDGGGWKTDAGDKQTGSAVRWRHDGAWKTRACAQRSDALQSLSDGFMKHRGFIQRSRRSFDCQSAAFIRFGVLSDRL